MGMTNRGKKLTGWFDGPWFDPNFASDDHIIVAPGPSLGKGRTLGPTIALKERRIHCVQYS